MELTFVYFKGIEKARQELMFAENLLNWSKALLKQSKEVDDGKIELELVATGAYGIAEMVIENLKNKVGKK